LSKEIQYGEAEKELFVLRGGLLPKARPKRKGPLFLGSSSEPKSFLTKGGEEQVEERDTKGRLKI